MAGKRAEDLPLRDEPLPTAGQRIRCPQNRFRTRETAERAAWALGGTLEPVWCPLCQGWHLHAE